MKNPDLSKLPETCYSIHLVTGEVVILQRGVMGYVPSPYGVRDEEFVNRRNGMMEVTRQQRAAMEFGSILGYGLPGADPDIYDATGRMLGRRGAN